jgi:hypothetical protein
MKVCGRSPPGLEGRRSLDQGDEWHLDAMPSDPALPESQ